MIDKATADEYDWTVGDSDNLAGSRMVLMTLEEAQRALQEPGYHDTSR